MLLRTVAFFLIAFTCFAQTARPAGTPNSQDDITALTAQANQGNAGAQLKLGDAYLRGRGVPQNNAEALRLFRAAADNGNAEAQYVLGSLYAAGIANRGHTALQHCRYQQPPG